MAKVLFHIDLNAFFASAEELRHPELKNKPLAIGSNSARGVLSTCNYTAREYGIHSAMPSYMAKEMCPELVILDSDHEYYRKLSNQFFAYLKQYTGKIEIVSIDECFMDVTTMITKFPRPLDLAVQIQQGVYRKLGLKCSIGVAPTRFLAKMASDLRKPMGISVLRKRDIETKLYPLDVGACLGIGKKTVAKLKEVGIFTIGDLVDEKNATKAQSVLKNSWPDIQDRILGRSSDELIYSTTRKSVSHSKTYSTDVYTIEEVLVRASELVKELSLAMQKKQIKGSMFSMIFRDQHFNNQVRSTKLPCMTNDYYILNEAAKTLVYQYFEPVGYRHLGITVGSLANEEQIIEQPTLFDDFKSTTQDVIANLNTQIEGAKLMTLSQMLKEKESKNDNELERGIQDDKSKFTTQ